MIVWRREQDLTELIQKDNVGGSGSVLVGLGDTGDDGPAVATALGMPLALAALLGLVRHLGLREDSSKHHTFSFKIGKSFNSY